MPQTNEPDGNGAAGTDGQAPAATQTPPTPPAVTPETGNVPEGYELIRTEDKNNLVSQRDKANNSNSETDTILTGLLQERAVEKAVLTDEFKEKYPDVTAEDVLDADPADQDDILAIAEKKQKRYEAIKQNALKNATKIDAPPEISPEEKSQELKKLAGPNKPKNAFQRAIAIDLMKVIKK